jgi:ferredoxin
MPGVSVTVTATCTGCKLCLRDVCFVDAIRLEPGGYKGRPRAVVDPDRCRGCGRCVSVCPVAAIELAYGGAGSVGQTIERIAPLVDLG